MSVAATANAILQTVLDVVYGEEEEAGARLQAVAETLRQPLHLPGLGLLGAPSLLPDGQPDWILPALETRATLREVLEHLARWKRDAPRFLKGAAVLQTGVPVPVTLRMSLCNDTTNPHQHLLALQGPAKDVFLAVTLLLLAYGTTARVLVCPECHKVFLRNRRQTHCSDSCYEKWYWREKRTPQQKAEARRVQYEKRGWTLGAKGSPLGRFSPSARVKPMQHRSSRKGKGA